MARLRSQNGLGQKWVLLCQESPAWFSSSGDLLPYVLTPQGLKLLLRGGGGSKNHLTPCLKRRYECGT